MIVFSSTFAGNREIFVAAADGSGRVDLTRDAHVDVTPSWSADGKRIVFASDRAGAMEIYVMFGYPGRCPDRGILAPRAFEVGMQGNQAIHGQSSNEGISSWASVAACSSSPRSPF
jgi:hypothetical protein